jgi:GNAT superfamily N-acetyltransferase
MFQVPSSIAAAADVNSANFMLGNETVEMACATFVRSIDTPNIYDANHATNVRARTPAQIDELLAALDREFQHSGHRRFDVDYRTPPEFTARLALEGGFERDDALILLLEGDLHGSPPACDIRPLLTDANWETYWELMLQDWNEHNERRKRSVSEEIARQMWRAKKRKQPPVQYWLAYEGERAVAYFNSWEGVDGVGQVEDLFTHPEYRKRGIATALIHHCVAQARAKGAGPVVIVADPTDTPKNIYVRMGWRPAAVVSHLIKQVGATTT